MRAKKEQIHSTEGLLCFSKNWSNPLIWGHYAEKHTGVALGFDIPDHLLTPVRYRSSLNKFKIESDDVDEAVVQDFLNELRRTKFADWAYEDEFRQFIDLSTTQQEGNLHFMPFSPNLQLREVILGARFCLPSQRIKSLVAGFEPSVHVKKARVALTKFGVTEDRSFREPASK